jgi:hypothetical protein
LKVIVGPILVGPGLGRAERDFGGLLLLHAVRRAEEDVDASAIGLRARAARGLELRVDLGHELLVLGLVLVLGGVEIRVAARPEDLLELEGILRLLEALVGLLLLGKRNGADFVDPLLRVLVDVGEDGRGDKGQEGGNEGGAFHGQFLMGGDDLMFPGDGTVLFSATECTAAAAKQARGGSW